jgi:hypothetical protein
MSRCSWNTTSIFTDAAANGGRASDFHTFTSPKVRLPGVRRPGGALVVLPLIRNPLDLSLFLPTMDQSGADRGPRRGSRAGVEDRRTPKFGIQRANKNVTRNR